MFANVQGFQLAGQNSASSSWPATGKEQGRAWIGRDRMSTDHHRDPPHSPRLRTGAGHDHPRLYDVGSDPVSEGR